MRWMAIVLGLGLAVTGCKGDKKDEPVDVGTDEAKAEGKKDDATEEAKKDDATEDAKSDDAAEDGDTKTAKADEDDKDEDDKDEDDKDEDDKDEDTEDDGATKTADAKGTSTAAATAPPFGAGGLSACCAALDAQSKSTSGSNASRIAAASRQCFHLDGLVAQGKTTKGAALSQLKALSGVAPAACN